MKFSPKERFKHGFHVFEPGNTYDSELLGVSNDEVMGFYNAGWTEVQGLDPAPARQLNPVTINPKKGVHRTTSTEVNRG